MCLVAANLENKHSQRYYLAILNPARYSMAGEAATQKSRMVASEKIIQTVRAILTDTKADRDRLQENECLTADTLAWSPDLSAQWSNTTAMQRLL